MLPITGSSSWLFGVVREAFAIHYPLSWGFVPVLKNDFWDKIR